MRIASHKKQVEPITKDSKVSDGDLLAYLALDGKTPVTPVIALYWKEMPEKYVGTEFWKSVSGNVPGIVLHHCDGRANVPLADAVGCWRLVRVSKDEWNRLSDEQKRFREELETESVKKASRIYVLEFGKNSVKRGVKSEGYMFADLDGLHDFRRFLNAFVKPGHEKATSIISDALKNFSGDVQFVTYSSPNGRKASVAFVRSGVDVSKQWLRERMAAMDFIASAKP